MPNWIGMDPVGLPGVFVGQTQADQARLVRGISQTMLSPFERILLREDPATIDNIFFRWTPDVLLKIRRLSTSTFYVIEAYFHRRWNINRHLHRWFYDVPHFLRQLGACDGLISGSEALTFLDRCRFLGEDLDIYVPLHGVLPMGRFLKTQGYVFQPSPEGHVWFDAAAIVFITSQHGTEGLQPAGATSQNSPARKQRSKQNTGYGRSTFNFICPIKPHMPITYSSHVQLIGVSHDLMEYIINHFHSTGVMNMLTPTHAISLFPRTTFMREEMHSCRDLSAYPRWKAPWIDKYRKRGFRVFVASDRVPVRSELVAWKCKVGDSLTWILPYKHTALGGTAPTLTPYRRYAFEVLDRSLRVSPPGAVARVGPRFLYSPMAWLTDSRNPTLQLSFSSFEMAAAFAGHYGAVVLLSDEESSASDTHTGDTEEADW